MLLHPAALAALRRHAGDEPEAARGWLVGVLHGEPAQCVVLSACRLAAGCTDLRADLADLSAQLPAPLRALGAYAAASAGCSSAAVRQACAAACAALDGGAEALAGVAAGTEPAFFAASGEPLSPTAVPDSWVADTFAVLRCRFPLAVRIATADAADALSQLDNATDDVCGPQAAQLVESADKSRRALLHSGAGAQQTAPQRVGDVAAIGGAPASVAPLVGCPAGDASAPLLRWQAEAAPRSSVELAVDVLAYASPQQALLDTMPPLRAALRAQLQGAASSLRAAPGSVPTALHFQPPGLAHAITVIYALPPAADADAALAPARAALHARWGLPCDRPLLRLACALPPSGPLRAASAAADRLVDPHLAVPGSGVPGGVLHAVRGSYLYYHYKQDRFDDAGWGCAYRSCQTLVSWFRMQAYTALPVPSHADIQQALVAMGDKEQSFLGSKQWIGAIELMYILTNKFDVSCKLVTAPRGDAVGEHVRALAAHFDAHGTPVMIGGGVLAYTLLGVDWNERTGETAFLILDPHYIGADDVASVVPAWCGWRKAQDVFVADAFYNFMCPQRPNVI